MTDEVVEEIVDVWCDYDDFKHGGYPYVTFVIEQDLKDIRYTFGEKSFEKHDKRAAELADICINAMRMMIEQGYSPQREILDRLDNHRDKGQEEIIERYQTWYEQAREESEMYP